MTEEHAFWEAVQCVQQALCRAQTAEQENIGARRDAFQARLGCIQLGIPLLESDEPVFGPLPVEHRLPEYEIALRLLNALVQDREVVECVLREQRFFTFHDFVLGNPDLPKIERLLGEKPFEPIVQTLAHLRKCGFRVTIYLGDDQYPQWNVNMLVPGQDRSSDQQVVAVCQYAEEARRVESSLRERMERMPRNLTREEVCEYALRSVVG